MADLTELESSSTTRLVGRDEQFAADVVEEDGQTKLLVKSSSPSGLGNLFFSKASNNGSFDMNVNGSSSNVEFVVEADDTRDVEISSMAFQILDGGIKVSSFLGLNSALSNGILIEIKSNDEVFQFLPITSTQEFDSHFSWGSSRSFEIIFASGDDSLIARYGKESPFTIKAKNTFATDDYIKVIVRDDLRQVSDIKFIVFGEKK